MLKKDLQIEYIRAIAATGVVAIHTIYSGILYSGDSPDPNIVLFFTIIKNLLYWAVPCFGMISGQLLLDPEKQLNIFKILKYFFRVVAVLLIFGTVFSWIEIVFNERVIAIQQIPMAFMAVLKHHTWEHLWYLYALLTVYILLPFWRLIVKYSNNFVLIVLIFSLYILTVFLNSREISIHLFFLMGELHRRGVFQLKRRYINIGIISSSLLLMMIVYMYEVLNYEVNIFLGYTSLFVAIQAFLIFSLLYETDFKKYGEKIAALLLCISRWSFGIYIFHMVFVNLEYKLFSLNLMNSWTSIFVFPILIIINVSFSLFATIIINKIPVLNNII